MKSPSRWFCGCSLAGLGSRPPTGDSVSLLQRLLDAWHEPKFESNPHGFAIADLALGTPRLKYRKRARWHR